MTRAELERVRKWADEKIATGAEPPWAWYQYMKLRETIDAILAGVSVATSETESSPQSGAHLDSGPRLVVSNTQQGTAPHRQSTVPVPLPM